MTTASDFEDEDKLVEYLACQLRFGRLSVVLGAGISMNFGLPSWENLLERMFAAKKEAIPKSESLERQAEFLRGKHFKNDTPGFLQLTHDCLYETAEVGFNELRKHPTLCALGALVMASQRGNASTVITFNFDNVLELFLNYYGHYSQSLFTEVFWRDAADVTVIHPHGFLPFDLADGTSRDIVFDQKSYSTTIGDETNVWRQLLLSTMATSTCLFIGLSGADNNLDSVLIAAKERHAINSEGTAYWGVVLKQDPKEVEQQLWGDRNVFVKDVVDYEQHLPELLFKVCQQAALQRRG
jgi:hypothetical protein